MLLGVIPGGNEILQQGVMIKFRHVGNSIFIDVSLEGLYAEMVKAELQKFKIDISTFTESGEMHLISGIKLDRPLELSYEDMVKMATLFKVQGNGQMPSKTLFDSINSTVEEIYSSILPSKFKLAFKAFKLLSCFRKIEYNCLYDSDEMCTNIKDLAGKIAHNTMGGAPMDELNSEMGTQIIGSVVAQGQEAAKVQLEGIKQMATMFLEPYSEQLKGVNFDNIGLGITAPQYGAQLKFNLCLVGATEFLRNNILN